MIVFITTTLPEIQETNEFDSDVLVVPDNRIDAGRLPGPQSRSLVAQHPVTTTWPRRVPVSSR